MSAWLRAYAARPLECAFALMYGGGAQPHGRVSLVLVRPFAVIIYVRVRVWRVCLSLELGSDLLWLCTHGLREAGVLSKLLVFFFYLFPFPCYYLLDLFVPLPPFACSRFLQST